MGSPLGKTFSLFHQSLVASSSILRDMRFPPSMLSGSLVFFSQLLSRLPYCYSIMDKITLSFLGEIVKAYLRILEFCFLLKTQKYYGNVLLF